MTDATYIKPLIKKAYEKLLTSKIDLENNRYEDSASRAYYSVFHSISSVLLSKGLHFSSHKEVIGAFNKEYIHGGEFPVYFIKKIQKLFEDRQIGDYDIEEIIDKETAEEDYKSAEEIVNKCVEYLTEIYQVDQNFWKT
ncbi:MAG: HEPN domain-containing protein [Candidatus Hydrogenedentota bacterium]